MNSEQKNFLLKKEINILIDNIIKQEDELNKYLNTKDNQSLLIEISNNNQRIESLSNLIKKETNIAEGKTKKLSIVSCILPIFFIYLQSNKTFLQITHLT